jgi:hypothetical protein
MYENFRLLHSNSGFQGPAHGLCAELLRRINRIGDPLEIYQHHKTVVRSLERIPRIRKLIDTERGGNYMDYLLDLTQYIDDHFQTK